LCHFQLAGISWGYLNIDISLIQTDHLLLLHDAYAYLSQEEAIPELEIDVDELLDMENDVDRAARVKVISKMSDFIFDF